MGYRITAIPAGSWGSKGKKYTETCAAAQCAGEYIVTKISPGVVYTVTVAAVNAYGAWADDVD